MSPWTVYWVMQADSIQTFLEVMCFVCFLVGLFATAAVGIGSDRSAGMPREVYRQFKRVLKVSIALFFGLAISRALSPSTKTLCAVIAVPTIANNEQLQADAGEIYRLGMERLKDELDTEVEASK